MQDREISEIAKAFNSTVRDLITYLSKKARDDIVVANLDRVKQRIRLLGSTMGAEELVKNSAPFLIKFAKHILGRDEAFFNSLDIRKEYLAEAKEADPKDEFMFSLVDSIRVQYNRAPQTDKDHMYTMVRTLLDTALEYGIATAED